MFSVDHHKEELYIISTTPFSLIWVRPTLPEQFYVLKGEGDEALLKEAAEWYTRNNKIQMH